MLTAHNWWSTFYGVSVVHTLQVNALATDDLTVPSVSHTCTNVVIMCDEILVQQDVHTCSICVHAMHN